jgi:hypothetical protein
MTNARLAQALDKTIGQLRDAGLQLGGVSLPDRASRSVSACSNAETRLQAARDLVPFRDEAEKGLVEAAALLRVQDFAAGPGAGAFPAIPPWALTRFFLWQSAVATEWALADLVTAGTSRILGSGSAPENPRSPTKLSDIVEAKAEAGPGFLTRLIGGTFGWPIRVAYGLRNLLLHDGGAVDTGRLFERDDGVEPHLLSREGLEVLTRRSDPTNGRMAETLEDQQWPWADGNLLPFWHRCRAAMDEALIVLLVSAGSVASSTAAAYEKPPVTKQSLSGETDFGAASKVQPKSRGPGADCVPTGPLPEGET